MWREEIGVVQRQMAGAWSKVLGLEMLSAAFLLFSDLDSYLVDSQSGFPLQSFESFSFHSSIQVSSKAHSFSPYALGFLYPYSFFVVFILFLL